MKNFLTFTALCLAFLFLSLPDAAAQKGIIHQFDAPTASEFMGYTVSGAGDVNNDGFDDVIAGAFGAQPFSGYMIGSAYVYCGQTGTLLWRFDGQADRDHFAVSVSGAGDVDNDGFDDLIVGAYQADPGGLLDAGSAYVYSGQTGALLYQFDGSADVAGFGWSVSGAGDVDGDNHADLIVGAENISSGAGAAYLYSGANGSLIHFFDGNTTGGGMLGNSVSGAGDVNGDNLDDVIIGAPGAGPNYQGEAYIFAGPNWSTPHLTLTGLPTDDNFGWSVSGAGDVDGTGFDDVIVGSYWTGNKRGAAYVFSGQTGALIHDFYGENADDLLGFSVSGAGDVNLDGHADLIVGAHDTDFSHYRAGSAYVFCGDTGLAMLRLDGFAEYDNIGHSVAAGGDVNGDGCPDLVAGAPFASPGGNSMAGSVFVFDLGRMEHSFLGGADDSFVNPAPTDSEYSSPRPALLTNLQGAPAGPLASFDVMGTDQWFGHTFDRLPSGIIAARLDFRVRGGPNSQCFNDAINVMYDDAAQTFGWGSQFQNLPGGGNYGSGVTYATTLDLDALPGGTSLIDDLNSDGFLDVRISDDSGVDYVTLTVTTSWPEQEIWLTQEAIVWPFDTMTFTVSGCPPNIPVCFIHSFNSVGPAVAQMNPVRWVFLNPGISILGMTMSDGLGDAACSGPTTPQPPVGYENYLSTQALALPSGSTGPWLLSNTITAPVFREP